MAWRRKDLKNYGISLAVGCVIGFAYDGVGISLGLWDFPRQPFMSAEYWLIVVPCWGVFGATINMVNDWYLGNAWYSIAVMTILFIIVYEVPNRATGSWEYQASAPIVILGWFPLVLTYRLSYLFAISKITRVKLRELLEYKSVSIDKGGVKDPD